MIISPYSNNPENFYTDRSAAPCVKSNPTLQARKREVRTSELTKLADRKTDVIACILSLRRADQ
jgi:hypothetical protein